MTTDETGGSSEQSRGVSPAISVLLAAAITLVLAATVGAFVLGFGENTSEGPPSLSLSADQQGDRIILTHEAGETINTTNLKLSGVKGWGQSGEEFGAGDQISAGPAPGTQRVDIVFETEDSSSTLRTVDVSNIEVSSLVVNDGFERGTGDEADNWMEVGATSRILRTDERSLSGEYSMKHKDLTGSYDGRETVSESIDVTANPKYEFGGSYYLSNNGSASPADFRYAVRVRWFDAQGDQISETSEFEDLSASEQWDEVRYDKQAPANAATARLGFDVKEDQDVDADVYWDDMFIEPTD